MKLYHFSDADVDVLEPRIGNNRNEGEDSLAAGKPVVYFTTCDETIFGTEGSIFRYTVEIDSIDPNLKPDRPFNDLMDDANLIGLAKEETKWFFYLVPIKPIKKEKWNGKYYK